MDRFPTIILIARTTSEGYYSLQLVPEKLLFGLAVLAGGCRIRGRVWGFRVSALTLGTIQARHVVRGLMSETSLVGMNDDEKQQVECPTHKVTAPLETSSHLGSYLRMKQHGNQ